ncbi:MAG: CCA tRNA nucleotidyltransferase, partial [Brevundimonas sp.]
MTMLTGQDWLKSSATRAVLAALEASGGPDCARFVGGCVRNALMGRPIDDVDIATSLKPEDTEAAIRAAGLKAVPTGIAHGTVTAVSERQPFEITTLRRDVTTDGRNATVAFTDDWAEDAARRDFRLNALYADGEGQVFDPTGQGVADAAAGRIVFVGDPRTRIREDYLRILRFFRFFAWYGQGEPDVEGLEACRDLAPGISRLSAERVSKELMKLLAATDPRAAHGLGVDREEGHQAHHRIVAQLHDGVEQLQRPRLGQHLRQHAGSRHRGHGGSRVRRGQQLHQFLRHPLGGQAADARRQVSTGLQPF